MEELALGARIRSMRQARRLTLRQLADQAGVTESFLSQVEREVASPSIASVQRIARALDLSIAELFAATSIPARSSDATDGGSCTRASARSTSS